MLNCRNFSLYKILDLQWPTWQAVPTFARFSPPPHRQPQKHRRLQPAQGWDQKYETLRLWHPNTPSQNWKYIYSFFSIVSEFLGVLFMKVVYVFCPNKHQHAAKRVRGKWFIFLVNVFALAASPSNVPTVLQSSWACIKLYDLIPLWLSLHSHPKHAGGGGFGDLGSRVEFFFPLDESITRGTPAAEKEIIFRRKCHQRGLIA